ncbi:MAG: hypothetical protein ACK5KR_02840 [Breznakia sp.]
MKKIVKIFVAALIAVTYMVPLQQSVFAAHGDPVAPINTISRNDGGGKYGTHKNPDYKDGDTQYYRDGDIIEVDFSLPVDSGAQTFSQIIKYDSEKLDLLSSDGDISDSMASNYDEKKWMITTTRYDQDKEQIFLFGGSANFMDSSTKDFVGGTIGKAYFRVKDDTESVNGTPLTFEFSRFQTAEYDEDYGDIKYSHIGYDPNNDKETAFYSAPSQTVLVKKPNVEFGADDAFITQSEAKELNSKNDLKEYSDVNAELSDGTKLNVTTDAPQFNDIKEGELGSYDVTYGYTHEGNSDSETVKLNVVADDAIISPEKNFALTANNGFICESDAKKLNDKNSLIPINEASVLLKDGTSVVPNVDAPAFASIKNGDLGTYEATYSYGSGADSVSKDVYVTIVKDGSVISPDKDFALYAKNGFIKDNEAKNLTSKSDLFPYNDAEVTLVNGATRSPNATLAPSDWLGIISGVKATYNVLYDYGDTGNIASKRVKITVIGAEDPISPDKEASLYAHDVELFKSDAMALTSQNDLIALNGALVTMADGSTGKPSIASVDYASIKAGEIGTYPVLYTYGSGQGKVERSVNVKVVADQQHEITYNDKIITVDEAKSLSTKEDLRLINDVQVTTSEGTHPNATVGVVTPSWSELKAGKIGSYTVEYSYGYADKLVSVTAKIVVVENGSEINDKASLYAQNGFVEQSQAKELVTKNDLILYNNASVTLLEGGFAQPTPNISGGDWYLLKAGELGSYNVRYTYETLSKGVLTTVIKDGSSISEDKSASLYAENAFISVSDAIKIKAKEDLRAYNKASVTLMNGTSEKAIVDIALNDLLAIQSGTVGAYDVLYSYGQGNGQVSKKVKIVVIDDDAVISEDGQVALSASAGDIGDTEAKKITNKNQLIPYNQAKVTFIDGREGSVDVTISTNALNAIKNGIVGGYDVLYSYGEEGSQAYVSKVVDLNVVIKTKEFKMFDYDNGGTIDGSDLMKFRKYNATPIEKVTPFQVLLSDKNQDERIDSIDLVYIQYYYSSKDVAVPTVAVPIDLIP